MECLSCLSNSGARRISPGPTIYDGTHWVVEHAYPTSLAGWLVIVARRHVEALHDLTPEEFEELARLQQMAVRALRDALGCRKEYVACFAEAEGFAHIHFHIVPRAEDLDSSLLGPRIFDLIKPGPDMLQPQAVQEVCAELIGSLARKP